MEPSLRLCLQWGLAVCLGLNGAAAAVAATPDSGAPAATASSRLDAPLFYQLLIGEIELRQGQPATAYAVLLDAARRTRDEALFQRAVEIALRAQAGNEALTATLAWRAAHPKSLEAVRTQVRILLALNRLQAMNEPLRQFIELTPEADRAATIAGLPRLFKDHPDPRQSLQVLQSVLIPLAETAALRTPAQLALARSLLQAGQGSAAMALASDVGRREPDSTGAALLALEVLGADGPGSSPVQDQAKNLLTDYLNRPGAQAWIRAAYAQWLAPRAQQAALAEYRKVVRDMPDMGQAWYALGALAVEAGERQEAEEALRRFLDLQTAARAATSAGAEGSEGREGTNAPSGVAGVAANDRAVFSARMMLSQLATDRGDFAAAQRWLEGVEGREGPEWRREVLTRRALILARQGQVEQARSLIRSLPETSARDGPIKALTESQMLRSIEKWRDARTVLTRALEAHRDNTDLLYELALVLERLGRHDEMERHLRRIIEIRPEHHHAHNALGYSLAERNIRLEEAQALIARALELAPGDPFITDSAAWVAFRQGRLEQAEELLRQAYAARSDTEIGTHLAEVLWARGQREQARQIWRDLRRRDAGNKLLRDTLARLKVDL